MGLAAGLFPDSEPTVYFERTECTLKSPLISGRMVSCENSLLHVLRKNSSSFDETIQCCVDQPRRVRLSPIRLLKKRAF